jgi:coenzyme F420 hydrogenase subunit beta
LDDKIRSIEDVAERQLCTGCGVCAFAQPELIRMVDAWEGRRPLVRSGPEGTAPDTSVALEVCPGAALAHRAQPSGVLEDLRPDWGPVLAVWEGYAADGTIRFAGSSGGAATALALHELERRDAHGVLHIRARDDRPLLNETVLSRDRRSLLEATGSRYAPASPCDRLDLMVRAPGSSVFIGKPCDVAAVSKMRERDPDLDQSVQLTIAIFCAGTPSLRGTHEMLGKMGIDDPDTVRSVRYRGKGWPGEAEVVVQTPTGQDTRRLTYDESWNQVLQKHRQWRCYVCADHTGEFADIAVGDPWYREIEPGEAGHSLVLARTERGRQAVEAAIDAGYLFAAPVSSGSVPASQPGLIKVRGAVWGRIMMSRALRIPAPRYNGLPTFPAWLRLPLREKLRSTLGLIRRARRKQLHRRHPVSPIDPEVTDG